MKKSIILSAVAGLAISASAQTVQINPAPFSPETLVGGQAVYPVQVDGPGQEHIMLAENEAHVKFIKLGGVDNNSWTEYTVENVLGAFNETFIVYPQVITTMGVTVVNEWDDVEMANKPVIKPVASIGFTSGQTIEAVDSYYKAQLTSSAEGGLYFTTDVYKYIDSKGKAGDECYSFRSKQNQDGTYWWAPINAYVEDQLLDPAFVVSHANLVKFISQPQYEFHILAEEAKELAASTEYRGGIFADLKAAAETEGANWRVQCVLLKQYIEEFRKEILNLSANLDLVNFGTIDFDKTGVLTITCTPGDKVKLNVVDNYFTFSDFFKFKKGDAYVDAIELTDGVDDEYADGVIKVQVYYLPEYPNNQLDDHANVAEATIHVVIEGANSQFIMMSPSFDINVNGVCPAMSFDDADMVKEEYLAITSWEKPESIYFYSAGYGCAGTITDGWFQANNDKFIHNMPTYTIEGKDADKFDVEIIPSTNPMGWMFDGQTWEVKVALNTPELDIFDARIIISDTYNPANNLTLNVEAGNVGIAVVGGDNPEKGIEINRDNTVKQINFPLEGGKKQVLLYYENFKQVNAHKQVEATSSNPAFQVRFPDSPDATLVASASLEGDGWVIVDIDCDPATVKGITEGEIKFWINDKEVVIPVTRTYPMLVRNMYDVEQNIWKVTDEKLDVEVGGDDVRNYEHEVEFIVKDLTNYYNVDDLQVYTDQSVFEVTNTQRWFNYADPYKNGALELTPAITVNIKYNPCEAHSVDHGHLFVRIPGKTMEDNCLVVELKGVAGDAKTLALVKGETDGIANVEAETVGNKTVYTITGARASKATKGLVIENGVKTVKK